MAFFIQGLQNKQVEQFVDILRCVETSIMDRQKLSSTPFSSLFGPSIHSIQANGCLRVVPGSHLDQVSRPHKDVVGGESPLFILSSKMRFLEGMPFIIWWCLRDFASSAQTFQLLIQEKEKVSSSWNLSLGTNPLLLFPAGRHWGGIKQETGDRKKEWWMDAWKE